MGAQRKKKGVPKGVPNNFYNFPIMFTICKTFNFEAAHQLPDEKCYGKCSRLHGHSYKLEVKLTGEKNGKGWVVNFSDIKVIVKEYLDDLDHTLLNETFEVPTAENMIGVITMDLAALLQTLDESGNFKSITCRLWETPTCWAEKTYNYKD